MRLIDADELREQCHTIPDPKGIYCGLDIIEKYEIDDAPTVDVLDKIRDEIEHLHHHPKLDFIKNDEVVEMALEVIDKYR